MKIALRITTARVASILLAFSIALPAAAAIVEANASMDGAQVVPGSGSTASGTAHFSFDTVTNLVNLTATVNGIFLPDITFGGGPLAFGVLGPMHIHEAAAGANGPVVVPFPAFAFYTATATGLTIQANGVTFNPAILSALLTDGLYLQIHTLSSGGGGEIRGQVRITMDTDNDGVSDADDNCANTVIPESLPTRSLGINRFALVDGDDLFDTMFPKGNGPRRSYTTVDTAGCSCTQIIDALGLGDGHTKFGCSISAMDDWVELVN